jgi:hypothetical protein
MERFTPLWEGASLVRCHFAHSQGSHRDLVGSCPSTAPVGCELGIKWSPNGAALIGAHITVCTVLTF